MLKYQFLYMYTYKETKNNIMGVATPNLLLKVFYKYYSILSLNLKLAILCIKNILNSSNETIFIWILLNYGMYIDYVNIFSISIEYDLKVNWNWLHSDQLAKCHNPSPQLDCDRLSVLSSSIKMLGHGEKIFSSSNHW